MAKRKAANGQNVPLWSRPIPIAEIPDTGRMFTVTADDGTRNALAKAAGLSALPRLTVSVELFRHGHDGVRVAGQVSATVEQICVISLDPVQSEIAESFDLLFVPPVGGIDANSDVTLEHSEGEPPEALHNGVVDIGAVAAEYLLLGVDPYPRKPGAEFDAPPADNSAANPFAVLAVLKKPS